MTSEDLPVSAADGSLLHRAGRFAGWAARTGVSLGRRLPGVDNATESLRLVERQVFSTLRKRLDEVDDPYVVALSAASSGGEPAGQLVVTPEPLRAAMKELLDRSVTFDRDRAREYLYATVLRQLTPDEARILSVLSNGSPAYPAVDVVARGERILLRNASTVGSTAGVTLLDEVPSYLTRLAGLGLIDITAAEAALSSQYEILATDELVRAASATAKRVRLVRHTVRVSRFGTRFWAVCDPEVRTRVL
ncbi:Abi-alpha family protein [Amycolatopsis sp. GM8]|uniref:Abi-alpha family protein n=1 Tax=Amycolatopsis sp. GM8 TaxID=2896530 RepID=UPI001F333C0E|nr:Abi-alpha family protein [Amycolatopsis sp. GM8]